MSLTEKSSVVFDKDGKVPEYICIDYPANVVNVDKMISTLGGDKMISQVYSEPNRRLELRFRPDDIYCKPACGDRASSTSLLIKIKRRVKKKSVKDKPLERPSTSQEASEGDVTIESTLMGAVKTTYRFNTMCDAQYLPVIMNPSTGEVEDLPVNSFCPKGLEDISWLDEEPQHLFLPPAAFSRMDIPQAYFYRGDGSETFMPQDSKSKTNSQTNKKTTTSENSKSNIASQEPTPSTSGTKSKVVTCSIDIATSTTKPNVICRTRPRRTLFAVFRSSDSPTPLEPQSQALEQLQIKLMQQPIQPVYERLKKLFDERPIWSKNAIRYCLSYGCENLKYFLPTIAYYFKDGPWRNLWVKFGYDPRAISGSYMYQTFDYRLKQSGRLKSLIEAKRNYSNYMLPYKSSSVSKKKVSVIQTDHLLDFKREEKNRSNVGDNEEDYISEEEEEYLNTSDGLKEDIYIFRPGTIPPHRQMFYQYCDLLVPEIETVLEKCILSTDETLQCDSRYGWLNKDVEDECRKIVNCLIDEAAMKKMDEQKEQQT